MSESPSAPGPKYYFENELSGRLFCWLIDSGKIDLAALMDAAFQEAADADKAVKRLAEALESAVGRNASWQAASQGPGLGPRPDPARPRKAPEYFIWFRPSPSKKIRFKEVARALLVFTGRIPPDA